MGTPGPLELIIIFAVVLLIFGAKRIPEIARGIGKGIREFKDATSEISRELEAEGQKRKINQPQSPQQGAPQARQPQQQGQPPQQGQPQQQGPPPQQGQAQSPAPSESANDAADASEAESETTDTADAKKS